jgi:hypothetical protein
MRLANSLLESGRGHALSAVLLRDASLQKAQLENMPDAERFAFNGPHSLSVHYLLGLGIELMLKAALSRLDDEMDDRGLRGIGHNLIRALDLTEAAGFISQAPNLRELVGILNEPYQSHWLRYERPGEFPLPGDFEQVVETLAILDEELRALIQA